MRIRNGLRRGTALIGPALAACLALAVPALGGEEEDCYAALLRRSDIVSRELDRVLRGIDNPEPLPEYPERMLSVRRNASVRVGGELRVSYIGSRGGYADASFGPDAGSGARGKNRTTDLTTTTAAISIDARLHERWRAYLDINLNGYSGFHRVERTRNPNAPGDPSPSRRYDRERFVDTIGEAYVEFLKTGHSGFGFRAGIMELPFGLSSRPDLLGRSFLDAPNLTGSYLAEPLGRDDGQRLPHASRLLDPVVAIMLNYELRDIIRFEAGVFQEREGKRLLETRSRTGSRRLRTDSPLPYAWQAGVSILPLEDWELSVAFRNRYSRSRGVRAWADSPQRWDFLRNMAGGGANPSWDAAAGQWSDAGGGTGFGARSNEQALAVGLAVEIPNTALRVQLEYAHGWNGGFNKYINSDDVNLGLAYRLTPFLTLHGQAEWLMVRDKSWMGGGAAGWSRDSRHNRLYRFLLGAEYELLRGLSLEGGWQYEYWNCASALGADGSGPGDRTARTNMFYLGTRFIF